MEVSRFKKDFEKLPKHIQKQLIEYAEFFVAKFKKDKKKSKKDSSLQFTWENGLEELKGIYTSVELQHKIDELK